MKSKILLYVLLIVITANGCSKNIEYSEEFKKETKGKYLYNLDEIIEVSYENNKLYIIWKEGKILPVALDTNEFFVADMYTKLHFVEHPVTKKRYLSKLSEDEDTEVTYDYIKVADSYRTPSKLLKDGEYQKALDGYMAIKQQDSTSSYINEWDFNRLGYQHIRDKAYIDAIEVFKINAALHPNSPNVYDSLAEAYLRNKDSTNAYVNYKISYDLNPRNRRAKSFIDAYKLSVE